MLQTTGRGREGALVAGARGHPVESLGDRFVRTGGGVGLVPPALLPLYRLGQRAMRDAALGGQRRVRHSRAGELMAERDPRGGPE